MHNEPDNAPLTAFQIAREHGNTLPLDLPLKIAVRDQNKGITAMTCAVHGYDIDEDALTLVITIDPEELRD
jgi:hypothetical protein